MIAGWIILALGLVIGIYDAIAVLTKLPTISARIQSLGIKYPILVGFAIGALAGHLVSF